MLCREALLSDLEIIVQLLTANNLPSSDCEQHLNHFIVFENQGKLIGVGGMEIYGAVALIRSIVVIPERRNKGLAKKIIMQLEEKAKLSGVKSLFLITESAVKYFEQLGFSIEERVNVPVAIKNTAQFKTLCPDSAIVMRRSI